MTRLVSVAKGEYPADLILTNARVVNVFSGEVEPGDVAICGDRIAGIGDYRWAEQVLDLHGKYLAPGLINGHIANPSRTRLSHTRHAFHRPGSNNHKRIWDTTYRAC